MKDYLLEETEIELTDILLEAITGKSADRELALYTIISSNEPDFKTMLGGYYYDSKGSVERIKLKTGSLELFSDHSGMFYVHYFVNYHMGCSDISYDDRQEMKIAFEIDTQRKVMKLVGERIPLRGPDEL